MPESKKQCDSVQHSNSNNECRHSRQPLICVECHKKFETVEELYLHLDACIIESFENEAINTFSNMPALTESTNITFPGNTHAGVTAKGDDPPVLLPETNTSISSSSPTVNFSHSEKCEAECSKVKTSEQRFWSSSECIQKVPFELENARILESPSGLKIYVSIEKRCKQGSDGFSSENDSCDYDFEGMHLSKRKVNEALTNTDDDDTYRPKMKCPTCGLVLYRHNFGTHYRIHTGELPFVCTYCQKRFRTTSALKVHIRAHTGEKPYSCPECSYSCITKRNLDRHIINNHIREGERRGPRERRSRYRRDEYSVVIDDVEMETVEGSEKVDHYYATPPSDVKNRNVVKDKANDEMEVSDDSSQADELPVLPLLVL